MAPSTSAAGRVKRNGEAADESAAPAARRRGRRRDQEVLDAACQVFYARGYREASVQDIADALGILKGSLYHYIDSKEDLLFSLLGQVQDELDRILARYEADGGSAPLDRLRGYIESVVTYNVTNLPQITIYYRDMALLSEERRAAIDARKRAHEALVLQLVRQAQRDGEADPLVDAQLTTELVLGAAAWIYRWYQPKGRISRKKIATACADFVMHGVIGTAVRNEREG